MSRIIIKNLPRYYEKEQLSKYLKSQSNLDVEITDISVAKTKDGDAEKAVRYLDRSYIESSRIEARLALDYQTANEKLRPWSKYSSKTKELKAIEREKEAQKQKLLEEKEKERREKNLKRKFIDTLQDDKARTFLQLSTATSKSRTWDNEDYTLNQEPSVAEANEKDEEYQDLPSAKRQQTDEQLELQKSGAPTVIDGRPQENLESVEGGDEPQARHSDSQDNGDTSTTVEQKPMSDEEWLRLHRTRIRENTEGMPTTEDQTVSESTTLPESTVSEVDNSFEKSHPSFEEEAQPGVSDYDQAIEQIQETKRLFLRNLTYSCTEEDISSHFQPFGALEQVHMPIDKRTNVPKGFAYVEFREAEDAVQAFQELDGRPFQGRLLHILPAKARHNILQDEFALSKLPLKKQKELKRKHTAATSTFSWNTLYMNNDAVVTSLASRLGVKKTDILDPTSSDSAVRQALSETHVVQETKRFFEEHGVDLDAFKNSARSDNVILAKNFPYGTTAEELTSLFGQYGELGRVLIPPAGTIAIIEFVNTPDARQAFSKLAYNRIKSSILYLEKAPKDVFQTAFRKTHEPEVAVKVDAITAESANTAKELETEDVDSLDTATLYVKNLNFSTKQSEFQSVFKPLEGYLSAVIRAKPDPKRPGQFLSMGFGFVEFKNKQCAVAAMQAMNGFVLAGHKLDIKLSHQGADAAAETRKQDSSKPKGTKILIKNLPFEASRKDIQSLFGAYGQLRSVRVPRKFDRSARGFAFAEFVTAREAENAMNALKHTHLLGRHLVLQYASTSGMDDLQHAMDKAAKEARAEAGSTSFTGKRLIETGENE
ncbi:RNA-binding protein Mrd1 [Schizosaccharomyces cryophilus OY26]|uniref:Multiple RNA-binding domain-containing protein 1 n=1 Tax=Schizosaccharomyces cryophilus (strain OY26 / ATCC MYA-4695 / CBS 11777 / NBRC 106824 / NRRL Y48691) TaxID=653667 RepID=S9VSX7_SCHCR|nr:RNA-binding protein Mrd1 [Schizosaccharomyces cryophilus OY26]EPY49240.1 RNA-binding protein Mrd1 [Schizosaccharomyces cryophilus OY26]